MDKILITGGVPLKGIVPISGAKNSALKLMAVSLLSENYLRLNNIPNLADTRFMAELLKVLGVEVEWPDGSNTCSLTAKTICSTIAPYEQVRKMRATFNVLGPLLARMGHATVSLPGGCAIGARPVDMHLKAFEAMGADIVIEGGYVKAAALRGLKGAHIVFPFISVGATEHAILAATLAKGETKLDNTAQEPEIIDLVQCLRSMGANIEGEGTSTIYIEGVSSLDGTTHRVIPDRIEAGTYAIAAMATGGEVFLQHGQVETLSSLIIHLRDAGALIEEKPDGFWVKSGVERPKAVNIDTRPFPGFPTDLQAQFMSLMTLAEGTSRICENIFENRFMHAPELARLGARIEVGGNEALIYGVEALHGAPVMATDLRASVSLVIAGLAAKGETEINRIYHLDRGFENLEKKLTQCGAKIKRVR